MKKTNLALLITLLLCSNIVFSQTLGKNTEWLTTQLNTLVKNDKDNNLKVNNKESAPTFGFKGCLMNMNIDAKDKDFDFGMNFSWLLKDVQKVSYAKEKDGNYELRLIVPADRMKVKLGFGRENSVSGSFNLKDEDSDNKTNFSLSTKDETLVRQIVDKFEESVRVCKSIK